MIVTEPNIFTPSPKIDLISKAVWTVGGMLDIWAALLILQSLTGSDSNNF